MKTPGDYRLDDSKSETEQVLDIFDEVTEFRMQCPWKDCGEKVYASRFRVNVEEICEIPEMNNHLHPLYQMDSWKELLLWKCPECERQCNFKGGASFR